MTRLRPFLFGVLPALLMGSGPSLLSQPLAGATQAPKLSLDMVNSDNSYDSATNSMTVGTVDNCLATGLPGNNAQHNHVAHLVIQNVEDLVGWQARLNYDGGKMSPATVNFSPFTDDTTLQNVSLVNLPLDAGVHRGLVTASTIPPQATGPQTALIGSVYNGTQSFVVSPDSPAKSTPDDTSYSGPSGGVLAAINLQVLAGQAGLPLYIDLDDGNPNAPGSELTIFTSSGSSTVNVAESDLGDGFHGEGVPCVPIAPPAVPLPPPAPPAGAGADSPSADSDTDGFSDTVEPSVGTDPLRPCGIDGWPADINNDTWDDIRDVSDVTGYFGWAAPPAPARRDLAPDPPDGFVDITDISKMVSFFGTQCGSAGYFQGACGGPQTSNHWYVKSTSGSGYTNNGTKVWTFTPSHWSVDKTNGSAWNEAAWLWWAPSGVPSGSNALEVGFFSG